MDRKGQWRWVPLSVLVLALGAVGLLWPTPPVAAQCGSQASSCKNCHEIQGQFSVNTSGDWHIQHAFGDFCEFCHGGNVQDTSKEGAHAGMVAWSADPKASCSTCHASDYVDKGETYAIALGVTLGQGGGEGSAPSPASGGGGEPATAAPAEAVAPVVPASGQIIDLNQPDFDLSAEPAPGLNWGNLILGLMILGLTVVGGAFIWWREGLGSKFVAWRREPEIARTLRPAALPADWSALIAERPELADLLPTLLEADPQTLQAVARVLADGHGADMLQALGRLDLSLVEDVRKLGRRERELLWALAEA